MLETHQTLRRTGAVFTVMHDAESTFQVRVAQRSVEANDIVRLSLRRADGHPFPTWTPGAHIDIAIPGKRTRQYSLAGDPADPGHYVVGVLRQENGTGVSKYLHDEMTEGDVLEVGGPRNHFGLDHAVRYIFIAGGIGITPILPMIAAAAAQGSEWSLLYAGRSLSSMGFRSELAAHGDRVSIHPKDSMGRADLGTLLDRPIEGALVYCCGPEALLSDVEARCAAWPPNSLRLERFAARPDVEAAASCSFEIVLAQSGRTLTVPPDRSILSVVEDAGIPVLCSCGEGTCGSCETAILDGVADHRDSVLTADERATNGCMMICVSRSRTPRLTLDI